MTKESYVKPDVSSEVLEPGALAQSGSGGTGDGPGPTLGVHCGRGPD